MCGIIGIASNKPVSSTIINSLRKLEYRGYDSAGIATLSNGIVSEAKSEGRVDILEKNLAVKNMSGAIGIGHVRWATHGIPNTINAHPHSSESVCGCSSATPSRADLAPICRDLAPISASSSRCWREGRCR